MRQVKLTRQEKAIEEALMKGEYVSAGKAKLEEMVQAIAARRKDAVLNIRVNGTDLKNIKNKAERLGVKYQTFISEVLHRIAGAR